MPRPSCPGPLILARPGSAAGPRRQGACMRGSAGGQPGHLQGGRWSEQQGCVRTGKGCCMEVLGFLVLGAPQGGVCACRSLLSCTPRVFRVCACSPPHAALHETHGPGLGARPLPSAPKQAGRYASACDPQQGHARTSGRARQQRRLAPPQQQAAQAARPPAPSRPPRGPRSRRCCVARPHPGARPPSTPR